MPHEADNAISILENPISIENTTNANLLWIPHRAPIEPLSCLPCSFVSPERGAGAGVGVGMLRGGGIPSIENIEFQSYKDSKFQSFEDSENPFRVCG